MVKGLRHLSGGIAEDLYCLKAVDRNCLKWKNMATFVPLQLGQCIRTNRQQCALLTLSFENISNTVLSV